MKIFSLLAGLLLIGSMLRAQEISVLPKDETGKYIYYEVVSTTNGINEDSLKLRAVNFINANKKEIKLKSSKVETELTGSGKIVITKSLAMLSHP